MQSCQHVFYAAGCGGCEARTVYGEMAAESKRQHEERMKAFERHQRERRMQNPAASRPAQPRQPWDVVGTLRTGGVLAAAFAACLLYVLASTLLFALMPGVAVAAGAAVIAKKLGKSLPGTLGRMSYGWWGAIMLVAVLSRVFHSDPVRPPIVNVTNLVLFVASLVAGFFLFAQYQREVGRHDAPGE